MDEQYHASPHIHRRSVRLRGGCRDGEQRSPMAAWVRIRRNIHRKGSVISCFGATFRSGYAGFNHAFSEFVASSRSTVACPSSSWGPISAPSRCTGRSASVPFQNLKELSTWSPVYGIQLIAPHRLNRKNRTQDLRRLRRYGRRWKIERLFAWLQNFRRLVVRYERYAENFLGMLHLGCCLILLRHI